MEVHVIADRWGSRRVHNTFIGMCLYKQEMKVFRDVKDDSRQAFPSHIITF